MPVGRPTKIAGAKVHPYRFLAKKRNKAGLDGRYPIVGVYTITCVSNGNIYVGSSGNCYQRICGHVAKLRSGKHTNKNLVADFALYGEEAFVFKVIERHVSVLEALVSEGGHIAALQRDNCSYNINPVLASIAAQLHEPRIEVDPLIAEMLAAATEYCERSGWSETAVGRFTVKDGHFFKKIRRNGNCTIDTYRKVMRWFDQNSAAAIEAGQQESGCDVHLLIQTA